MLLLRLGELYVVLLVASMRGAHYHEDDTSKVIRCGHVIKNIMCCVKRIKPTSEKRFYRQPVFHSYFPLVFRLGRVMGRFFAETFYFILHVTYM